MASFRCCAAVMALAFAPLLAVLLVELEGATRSRRNDFTFETKFAGRVPGFPACDPLTNVVAEDVRFFGADIVVDFFSVLVSVALLLLQFVDVRVLSGIEEVETFFAESDVLVEDDVDDAPLDFFSIRTC